MAIINGRGIVGVRSNVTVGPVAPATPTIITDGLKLYLDAGNSSSYPGTGTVWTDISGNGNTGTLNGGVTYNSSNGGSLVFNGTNGYVSINTPSTINLNNDVTIDLWVKFISFVANNPRILELQDSSYSIQVLRDGGNSKLSTKHSKWDINYNNKIWSIPVVNIWYNIVCIFKPSTNTTTLYQNGVELSSTSAANVAIGTQSNKIILGARSDFNSTTWLNAYLPNIKFYNKALSASEVLQNYDVLKTRFYPQVSDSDAQSFIYAAGIQDTTQASAVNTLVTSLKSYGIWTKMKAIYPMVGGTAASHKWNLKDPRDLDAAFRLTFTAGWVHSSTGALPNGTSDYARTYFNDSNLSINSSQWSIYNRTNSSRLQKHDFGYLRNNSNYLSNLLAINYTGIGTATRTNSFNRADYSLQSNYSGFYNGNRNSSSNFNLFLNGNKVATTSESTSGKQLSGYEFYMGCLYIDGTLTDYSTNQYAFASIGDGLSDTEAANFYTAVQAYQTTLGRQV